MAFLDRYSYDSSFSSKKVGISRFGICVCHDEIHMSVFLPLPPVLLLKIWLIFFSSGKIYDSKNQLVKPFPEVPQVLADLHQKGYELAIASRTSEIQGAGQLIKLLNWDKYFKYKEIYPGCKIKHFSQFCKASGFKHEDMLFFDDEDRNIRDLSEKGVTCIFVDDVGVTIKLVEAGLQKFAHKS